MENKEIYIDGVDVSGCEYYNKDDKTCREVNGKYERDICDFDKCENSNCYYKQLKRLEQENEELKAENERLKEEIKEVKKYQYEQEYLEKEIETAKVNLDIGKEEARHYLHEAYKFQKCLQEIKAIVCGNYEIIDPQGRKDILKLINKTEEE